MSHTRFQGHRYSEERLPHAYGKLYQVEYKVDDESDLLVDRDDREQ